MATQSPEHGGGEHGGEEEVYVNNYATYSPIALSKVKPADMARVREANERADRVARMGRRVLGPGAPKFSDAYMTVRPLLVRLTMLSTRSAYRSFKLLSMLQRVMQRPYLPGNLASAHLLPVDDLERIHLYPTCALLSSLVYPAQSVVEHGVNKVRTSKKWLDMKYRLVHGYRSNLRNKITIVKISEEDSICKPCYAVCEIKHPKAAKLGAPLTLYIVVRGSTEAADFVTDLLCDPVDGNVGPHRGMELSAEYLDLETRAHAIKFWEANPAGTVVLTGHSLGAGAAALLAIRWLTEAQGQSKSQGSTTATAGAAASGGAAGSSAKKGSPGSAVITPAFVARLKCVAIACPAILNEHAHYVDTPVIKTICFGKDIVPRLSFGSLRDLLVQMSALAAREVAADQTETPSTAGFAIQGKEMQDTSVSSSPSTAASTTAGSEAGGSETAGFDPSVGFDHGSCEWKNLPLRRDNIDDYKFIHRNIVTTDINFAGLTEPERQEQMRALAAQMQKAVVTLGGASFNQVNKILVQRVAVLDKERRKLMKRSRRGGILSKVSGFKKFLWKIFIKPFFGVPCLPTKAKLNATAQQQMQLLDLCLKELEALRCPTNNRFLTPPGALLLCVPRIHVVEQHRENPLLTGLTKVVKGQCLLYNVPRDQFTDEQIPVWSISALDQHGMCCYLQALAPNCVSSFPLEMIMSAETDVQE